MVGVSRISEKTQKASTVLLSSVCYCESGKAHLLERCSLFKVCLYMYESVCVLLCVLVIRAIAEPHTVRLLVKFNVILVNKTVSVQNIFPLLFRISGLISPIHPERHRGASREYKKEHT